MKLETFLNPANLAMAEAAPAVSTCGKYQRISKENIVCLLILTWGLLNQKPKMFGSEDFVISLHISVLLILINSRIQIF